MQWDGEASKGLPRRFTLPKRAKKQQGQPQQGAGAGAGVGAAAAKNDDEAADLPAASDSEDGEANS
jgi:hypothetical protein